MMRSWFASSSKTNARQCLKDPAADPKPSPPDQWPAGVAAEVAPFDKALAADPMLVKRLRRLRASRQKARAARRLGFELT